ncbi:MAG: hypothetical protein ACW99G_14200 [Candidatus Thorarchaeota archaeon]|jgi:hypothetical protein
MPYEFFNGEKKFYIGYNAIKNDDALPVVMEPTSYDIRMKCPKCNWVIKNQNHVEVPEPDWSGETGLASLVSDGFELQCNRCDAFLTGSVHSSINEVNIHIDGIEKDWLFWIKEV